MKHQSKKELIYETLRDQIITGQLEPGAHLVIGDLAAALGVSPIPVREALQQLSAEGLAVTQPYQGTRVSIAEATSVRELFEVIEALELISGRAALERFTTHDLGALEARITELDTLMGDPDGWSRANVALHGWLCERAHTPLVAASLARALSHWDRLRRVHFGAVFAGRMAAAQREHWLLFRAFKTHNLALLEAAIREHNASATAAYLEHLETREQLKVDKADGPGSVLERR